METTIAALVPIKDHSERLTDKNFRLFNGFPLHYWVIKTLMEVDAISMVYINTDSSRIRKYYENDRRITLIDRPSEFVGDQINMNTIIASSLPYIDNPIIMQSHVTNPLLKPETIREAINTYVRVRKQGYDSLFSVMQQKKRYFDHKGKPINHDPKILVNTQDLLPIFEENSCLYIFSKDGFSNNNDNRIGKKPYLFNMHSLESIDIDYIDEFVLAELIAREQSDA